MKRILLSILLTSSFLVAYAQSVSADLQSLVDAEWAFISLAKETNTRNAFWAQFTEETIVFGEGPVNAKRAYENQKPNAGWLKWEPVFSDIAASGDFGYNTGPWEFRTIKTDENAVAFGYFVSMWKKQENGNWKLLLDIGIDHAKPTSIPQWKTSSITPGGMKSAPLDSKKHIEQLEQDFIVAQQRNKVAAYNESLSREARLYRSGKEPITEDSAVASLLEQESAIQYHYVDGRVASTNDLAYAYGTAIVQLTTSQTKAANYLRIWKNEKDKGWRIVLDLVTYR
jgi:ketosteroid isomerase-like protein